MTQVEIQLRCPSNQWGFAEEASGYLSVRCRGRRCRTTDGKPVVHRFELATGSFTAMADHKRISGTLTPTNEIDEHNTSQ